MSHFYGTLNPNSSRKVATKCAHKGDGLTVTAASWQGAIQTFLYHDEETGRDMCRIERIPWKGAGGNGDGGCEMIYYGPVGAKP